MCNREDMPQNQSQHTINDEPGAGKQDDLAEGELTTVGRRQIRIHEHKGGLSSPEDIEILECGGK